MVRTAHTRYPHFPPSRWSKRDRRLFCKIKGDGDPFSEPGANCSDRNQLSWKALEYTYRAWLGCLNEHHPNSLVLRPAKRATQETVNTFMTCLRETCSDVTISIHLQRLYLVLRDMDKKADLQWLWKESRRLFKKSDPRQHVHVSSKKIRDIGVTMMEEARQRAHDYGYISLWTAGMYRKGLELVILAVLGNRRRTIQSLRLGEHLVRDGGRWWLRLTPDLTKEKKWSAQRLPEDLSGWIDDYVERFRPAFPGASEHDGFLAAGSGRPMHANTILQSVTRTTRAKLGKSVSPHALRRSLATEWKRRGLEHMPDARLHLDHENETITLYHYAERKMVVGNALVKALGLVADPPHADQKASWAARQHSFLHDKPLEAVGKKAAEEVR